MYFDEKTINNYYSKGGRKSKAIYNFYESQNLITHKNPKKGDLIFFSNTLGKGIQKNKDKKKRHSRWYRDSHTSRRDGEILSTTLAARSSTAI